ncbi:MAG: fibronectin type III domain-containing protein, partial [Bacteroidales bacterium]|nr:fibronectin type III domain-containing protein [Bacteroidales bacterium]
MKRVYIFFILLFSFAYNANADISQFPAPTNLNATNIQFGDASLSWSSNANGLFWIVSYNVSQSNYLVEETVSTNSIIISDLVLGTAYNWKVRMIDNVGDTTDWSNTATFLTHPYPNGCNPISHLSIDAMGPNGITVQWDADTTQNQWEIVYGELGSDPNIEGARVIVNNYFYLIPASSLILDNWYQIAVKNNCLGNESGWSFISTRYISNQYYNLPVIQTFEDDLQNSTFGFVNGSLNPWVVNNAYNITVDGNQSIYVSTNGGNTNDYYAQSPAISYAYIDVLIPSYASSFYLDFKWNCLGETPNDGIKVYLMGENTPLNINELPADANRIGQVFYNNSNYQWQSEHIEIPAQFVGEVRRLVFAWINNSSVGGIGGAIIDDIYITARYCAPPTNPTHSYVSSSYANISWDFAQGQDFFNVQYRKIGEAVWNQINSVTSNHSLQNLDDNTTYIYRVQADCIMEQSFFSPIDTFTTLIRCLPPENIHTISYSNNSAIISWNEDQSVTKWIFEYGVDNQENTIYNQRVIYNRYDTLTNLIPDTYYNI